MIMIIIITAGSQICIHTSVQLIFLGQIYFIFRANALPTMHWENKNECVFVVVVCLVLFFAIVLFLDLFPSPSKRFSQNAFGTYN